MLQTENWRLSWCQVWHHIYGATIKDKVGIMTTLSFQCTFDMALLYVTSHNETHFCVTFTKSLIQNFLIFTCSFFIDKNVPSLLIRTKVHLNKWWHTFVQSSTMSICIYLPGNELVGGCGPREVSFKSQLKVTSGKLACIHQNIYRQTSSIKLTKSQDSNVSR